ncbi:hypothetical protein JXR93_14545 [bacterium]|nr:hypothetical protein [bacterium]
MLKYILLAFFSFTIIATPSLKKPLKWNKTSIQSFQYAFEYEQSYPKTIHIKHNKKEIIILNSEKLNDGEKLYKLILHHISENKDTKYFLFELRAFSYWPERGGYCGSGEEHSLILIKNSSNSNVEIINIEKINSCAYSIESEKSDSINLILFTYTNIHDKENGVLIFDKRVPEKGIIKYIIPQKS